MVAQGWTKNEVYIKEVATNSAPLRITTGKEFLYYALPYNGNLYILTNEDSPRYRVFKTPVSRLRMRHWREIIPQSDAVLASLHIIGGQIFAHYRANAHSLLSRFSPDGMPLGEVEMPTLGTISSIGGEYDSTSAFYLFSLFHRSNHDLSLRHPLGEKHVWASVETGIDTSQVRDQAGLVQVERRHARSHVPGHAQRAQAHRTQPGAAHRHMAASMSA